MRTSLDVTRSLKRYVAATLGPEWEIRLENDPGMVDWPYCRIRRTTPSMPRSRRRLIETTATYQLACYAGPADTVEAATFAAYGIEEQLTQTFCIGGSVLDVPAPPMAVADVGQLDIGTYRYVLTALSRRGETLPSLPVSVDLIAPGGVHLSWTRMGSASGYRVYRGPVGMERLIWQGTANEMLDGGAITPSQRIPPMVNTAATGAPLRVPLYDYSVVGADIGASDALDRVQAADYLMVADFSVSHLTDPEEDHNVAVVAGVRLTWMRTGESTQGDVVVAAGKIATT